MTDREKMEGVEELVIELKAKYKEDNPILRLRVVPFDWFAKVLIDRELALKMRVEELEAHKNSSFKAIDDLVAEKSGLYDKITDLERQLSESKSELESKSLDHVAALDRAEAMRIKLENQLQEARSEAQALWLRADLTKP